MKSAVARYWDRVGASYNDVWKGDARELMSRKEIGFMTKYLGKIKPKKAIDIGFGTGRILEMYRQNLPKGAEIYGVDISPKMVGLCRRRYKNEPKIKLLKTSNAVLIGDTLSGEFNFITVIRVLKYNRNWKEILNKLCQKLSNDGVIIFTMPNRFSINRFAQTNYPIERSDTSEIRKLVADIGLEILEIRGFSWVPDYFYDTFFKNSWWYVRLLGKIEDLCSDISGGRLFSRILFIACQKK